MQDLLLLFLIFFVQEFQESRESYITADRLNGSDYFLQKLTANLFRPEIQQHAKRFSKDSHERKHW